MVRRIIHASDRQTGFPYSGSPRPEIAATARSIVIGSYTLYDRVIEETVVIVRVTRSSRKNDDVLADFNQA